MFDNVGGSNAATDLQKNDVTWANAYQFVESLSRNFSSLDLNGDNIIDKSELDVRINGNLKQPKELFKLGVTLNNHYDDIARIMDPYGQHPEPFSMKKVNELMQLTSQSNCDNAPSLGGTMARTVAGGAVGGGVGAKIGGDKFSDGAATGAAVGAVVGLVAYGIQSSQHQAFVDQRKQIDSWGEFKKDTCSPQIEATEGTSRNEIKAADTGVNRFRENRSLVESKVSQLQGMGHGALSETQILERLKSLKQHFNEIDANKDQKLSYDEIAEAMRSKLSPTDAATAAVVAHNFDAMTRLSADGTASSLRIEMKDFDAIYRIYEKAPRSSTIMRNVMVGLNTSLGGAFGAFFGGLIGLVAGGNVIPGAIIGGALCGGGVGLISNATTDHPDPLGESIGRELASHLRTELGTLH